MIGINRVLKPEFRDWLKVKKPKRKLRPAKVLLACSCGVVYLTYSNVKKNRCDECQRKKKIRQRIAIRNKHREADPEGYKAKTRQRTRDYRKRNPNYNNGFDPVKSRAGKLKRNFGITVEDYDALLREQGGVCAICKGTNSSGRRLGVDHCHATGKVRGLLCCLCNSGIGKLQDSLELVETAADYLRKYA